jgi:trans-aconitate 2-methyltransferase
VPRDWDAARYHRLSGPQLRWGTAVVDRLELRGDERVLDAGCGSGRVTALILERLPRGTVVAMDGSASMVGAARDTLAPFGDRVEFVVGDLLDPIPIEPVDAIFSNATFHWILDHDALFANLAAVLRPGGQLVAQCGGAGNIARMDAIVRALGHPFDGTKRFATPEETRASLERAGFTDIEAWLHPEPTEIPSEDFPAFIETVCLGAIVAGMDGAEREGFVRAVAERMPDHRIDYVRLNITARRAGEDARPR